MRGTAVERQQDERVRAVLAARGLAALSVIADGDGVAALESHPDGTLTFADALGRALDAFLISASGSPSQGHDSAHDVVRASPEDYGLGPTPTDAEVAEVLRGILASDPNARIVLLTPATVAQPEYRFLPEYGEGIAENWVFRIIAPAAWPLLQWSIVDVRGERAAYSYEFD